MLGLTRLLICLATEHSQQIIFGNRKWVKDKFTFAKPTKCPFDHSWHPVIFLQLALRTNVTDHTPQILCTEIFFLDCRGKSLEDSITFVWLGFSLSLCNWMYWSYWRELHCRVPRGILVEKMKTWKYFFFYLRPTVGGGYNLFSLISYNKSNEKIEIKRKRVATTFLINQCSKADSSHFVYLHERTFFNNISHHGISVRIIWGFQPKCDFWWPKKDWLWYKSKKQNV